MRNTTMLAVLAMAAGSAFSQRVQPQIDTRIGFGDRVVTHVADGQGWKTTITVVNLSQSKAAAFTLNFYGDDGTAKTFPFLGDSVFGFSGGKFSFVTGTLGPAGEIVIKTAGTSPGTSGVGWAMFDTSTSDNISGFAIFSYGNGNEAVVPFESWIAQGQLLSFDNTGGFGMGVALVDSDSFSTLTITATVYDEQGGFLGTETFKMAPLTHTSFIFSSRWPFTANHRGTVFFEPDSMGLAILGLRFTPAGAFTSVHSLHESNL